MARKLPTEGSADFACKYVRTFVSKMSSNIPEDRDASVRGALRELENSFLTQQNALRRLRMMDETPLSMVLETDESAHMSKTVGWDDLIMDDLVDNFGRYGEDAVSCLGEALLFTNSLARCFGTERVFYRGEQRYGWKLTSRAEREMGQVEQSTPGLTDSELTELRRFQNAVKSDPILAEEIFRGNIPNDEASAWLPAMQHYDTEFGTRLLDLTKSVFAGLYFACVGWDGSVDEGSDGLLYAFFDKSSNWRGEYLEKAEGEVHEFDDIAPVEVSESFKDWQHPEYFRLYQTESSNPRELAQDGVFLVRGMAGVQTVPGQGFKFRIPAERKMMIVKELWFAGYTPSRMVRGQIGRDAEDSLRHRLNTWQRDA